MTCEMENTYAGAAGILLLINGKLTFGKVKLVVPICINLPLLLISLFNFNVLIKIPCHDMASLLPLMVLNIKQQ